MAIGLVLTLFLAQVDAPAMAEARELVQEGQALFKAKRYTDAIAKFERALVLRPAPGLNFNIARCHEELGEVAPALKAYREYLRLAPNAEDRATVEASIASMAKQLGQRGIQQLAVYTQPPHARVEIDGEGSQPSPLYLELPPGLHTVVVTADQFARAELKVMVRLDRQDEVTLVLTPQVAPTPVEPPPAAEVPPQQPPADAPVVTPVPQPTLPPVVVVAPQEPDFIHKHPRSLIAGGVTVACLAAAIGLGVGSNVAAAELQGSHHLTPQADQLAGRTTALATGANVAWAAVGVAAITGVIFFVLEARE